MPLGPCVGLREEGQAVCQRHTHNDRRRKRDPHTGHRIARPSHDTAIHLRKRHSDIADCEDLQLRHGQVDHSRCLRKQLDQLRTEDHDQNDDEYRGADGEFEPRSTAFLDPIEAPGPNVLTDKRRDCEAEREVWHHRESIDTHHSSIGCDDLITHRVRERLHHNHSKGEDSLRKSRGQSDTK